MATDRTPRALRHWRRERALTQQQLAEELNAFSLGRYGIEVGVDAAMVSKWERGAKGLSLRYRRLLAEFLGIEPEQIAVGPELTVLPGGRAGAARGVATADGLLPPVPAPTRPLLRVAPVPPADDGPCDTEVDLLDEQLGRLMVSYPWSPARLHLARALHVKEVAERCAKGCYGEARDRMMALASEAALLAARLAFVDLGRQVVARGHCTVALEEAREARRRALSATALGWLALLAAHQRRHLAATAVLQDALRDGEACGDHWVGAWLEGVRGEVLIRSGQPGRALAALDAAGRLLAEAPTSRAPRWLDVGASRVAGLRGSALWRVGQAAEALVAFEEALAGLPPGALKQRATLLADLAAVLRDLGQPEQAGAARAEARQILVTLPLAVLGVAGRRVARGR